MSPLRDVGAAWQEHQRRIVEVPHVVGEYRIGRGGSNPGILVVGGIRGL